MSDHYDNAVEYLTAHPSEIQEAWNQPSTHWAGCLFAFCTPSRFYEQRSGKNCGCISQVKDMDGVAWTESLTERIRSDPAIPFRPGEIEPEHLTHFAKWQRIMDTEIRGPQPKATA